MKQTLKNKILPIEFAKKSITVMLIEKHPSNHSVLKKALIDFGYHVIKHISASDNILELIDTCSPEVLILVTDSPSDKVLKNLAEVNKLHPLPIVIFSENDSPNVIQQAIKSGVSAYVVNEILPQRIQSIISVANERFKAEQSLRNELKQAKVQLESKKYIDRAKNLLMEQKRMSANEAHKTLRKMALDQSCSIAIVAKNIIDVCQLLSPARS
ncbi:MULTISPECIES: ANTAR domain-containing protein [Thalassotalea]|uniref:ANTAR domain-containing protein n=1 Tax=Thalassotalea castellviae TaxID=3075612 RepID=A0ABU2ZXM2_9GAMM|nr:ANTAR domain-containing protein [Thalassotalea sp. W431]MDT0602681.1 ANTAR domain-containing protein [Thalassotalea sp. W431]